MLALVFSAALLGSGWAAGGLMISALGGAPLLMTLPTEQYIPVHQFLVTRFDPFMPISMCVAMVCDAVFAFAGGPAAPFVGAAAACLLGAMVVSLTRNVPINRWIATLDPVAPPADWARLDPRVRWRNWNLARTALADAALLLNVLAVAVLV